MGMPPFPAVVPGAVVVREEGGVRRVTPHRWPMKPLTEGIALP